MDIAQHRYRSYKEMKIFLIMCLKILIVLTLETFASFLLDLVPYECISSIVMKKFRLIGNILFLAL